MYALPTSIEQLRSYTSRTQNAGTQQHASIADVTGDNFAKTDIRIPFLVAGNRWWIPSRSYLRMRFNITELKPGCFDNLAPALGFAANMFQSAEFSIRGQVVSRISDNLPQIDQLIKRTTLSDSWMKSAGSSADFQQAGWDERHAALFGVKSARYLSTLTAQALRPHTVWDDMQYRPHEALVATAFQAQNIVQLPTDVVISLRCAHMVAIAAGAPVIRADTAVIADAHSQTFLLTFAPAGGGGSLSLPWLYQLFKPGDEITINLRAGSAAAPQFNWHQMVGTSGAYGTGVGVPYTFTVGAPIHLQSEVAAVTATQYLTLTQTVSFSAAASDLLARACGTLPVDSLIGLYDTLRVVRAADNVYMPHDAVAAPSSIEICWQPPLSIFQTTTALPSMSCELTLKARSGTQWKQACFETSPAYLAGVTISNPIPPVLQVHPKAFVPDDHYRIAVASLYFYTYQVESDRVDDGSFYIDLEETTAATQQLLSSQGVQQKVFAVSPSTIQLAVALQSSSAGSSTSPLDQLSKFKYWDASGPAQSLSFTQKWNGETEMAVSRLFLQYANSVYPQPDAEPSFIDNKTVPTSVFAPGNLNNVNNVSYITQRWLESQLNTGQYWSTGGPEPLQTWKDKGMLHVFPTLRDPVDRSTSLLVNIQFSALNPSTTTLLVLYTSRRVATCRVVNGAVADIDVQDQ